MLFVWLITVAIKTIKMLNLAIDKSFRQEKWRLIMIMFGFIFTYTGWLVWNLIEVSAYKGVEGEYEFVNQLFGILVVPAFCNFIPIMLVLYTHFKSLTSLSRILKLSSVHSNSESLPQNINATLPRTSCDSVRESVLFLSKLESTHSGTLVPSHASNESDSSEIHTT